MRGLQNACFCPKLNSCWVNQVGTLILLEIKAGSIPILLYNYWTIIFWKVCVRVRVRLRVHVSVCLSVCVCVSSQLNSTQLNSTQLNQRSPAQILDFAHIFSEERQTCIVINAKILKFMDEYLLSNPLFLLGGGEGGVKMAIFTWDSEPNYKGVKMASERWQHYNVIFTQRLIGLLVKYVHFSNLCCIMCQWRPFKYKETALFKYFLRSLHACNSRI